MNFRHALLLSVLSVIVANAQEGDNANLKTGKVLLGIGTGALIWSRVKPSLPYFSSEAEIKLKQAAVKLHKNGYKQIVYHRALTRSVWLAGICFLGKGLYDHKQYKKELLLGPIKNPGFNTSKPTEN